MSHRLATRFAAAMLAGAFSGAAEAAVENASLEYSVKAAYLTKFGGFVEWPAAAFASGESTTNLCIIGDDPFGGALEKAIAGQRIADHPVAIKHLPAVAPDSDCQILFIAGKDEKRITQTLAAVRGQSVLTITDGGATPATTGIINFVLTDNRVRFEIDDQAASANGVTISSKLLDLARTSKRRG